MSEFHGNFFVRSTDLLAMPSVPVDQSYAIEVQIEEAITAPFVVFQTAVLHTSCFGERRIRVVNLALPTTSYPYQVSNKFSYKFLKNRLNNITPISIFSFYKGLASFFFFFLLSKTNILKFRFHFPISFHVL